ncbi:alcohol oxidase [Dentipellis sp. KUC8613]|nr:alcohol oxidase [Dentipellis sp. KUC8613]
MLGFALSVVLAPSLLAQAVLGASSGGTASPCTSLPFPPSEDDVSTFLSTKFDYIIVGASTDFSSARPRLAEDKNLHVGVIEAGSLRLDDPIINVPNFNGRALGNPTYDWDFVSMNQANAAGRNFSVPRGKLLGGSSAINALAWNRASAPEYDAWAQFAQGNGWDWAGLLPSFKKSEDVSLKPKNPYPGITAAQAETAAADLPRVAGMAGPVVVSYSSIYPDVVSPVVETLNNMGIRTNPEPLNGNATGLYNTLESIDRTAGVRTYSAIGYFCDQPPKSNLKVLLGAQATKVLFRNTSASLTATGVQFIVGSKQYAVNTTKEVILSTGTVQTPQLLELSGIGNSTLLKSMNIPTLVDLPAVGENLQEHLFVGVQWQLKPGHITFDILRNNATFAAEQSALYNATGQGWLANIDSTVVFLRLQDLVTPTRLAALLQLFDASAARAAPGSLQAAQYALQRRWLVDGRVALSELAQASEGVIAPEEGVSYVFMLGGLSHPMSRGSVHIASNDPLAPPAIDFGYLSHDFDVQVLLDVLKYMQKIGTSQPFAGDVAVQTTPATDAAAQSDEALVACVVSSSCEGGDHIIGTAALGPRGQGGVVDSSLRVYGTANLRVVDASIIPIQVAGHSQSSAYAIAEKVCLFPSRLVFVMLEWSGS